MYLAMVLHKSQAIRVGKEASQDVPLSWADGMVGCIACFDSKEAAEAYSENVGCSILEVEFSK